MLRAKCPGENRVALGKGLLLAIVRDLNERVLTLLEKDLHVIGHESKVETRNRLAESSIWRKIKGDLVKGHNHFISHSPTQN